MAKRVHCIMLIDDNPDDNFFHERLIRKNDRADIVVAKQSGGEALNYLKARDEHENAHPDVIFLDINMPGMNGWEFLELYQKLDEDLRSKVMVVMLTTSENPDDRQRAVSYSYVSDFRSKPLTVDMLDEILNTSF
jgi:CheY-like chemotaxis protein